MFDLYSFCLPRSVELRKVQAKITAEAAELVERRLEVKWLEQDLVDAQQVVKEGKRCCCCCCCCTERRPMFDADTSAEESHDKNALDVRPLFKESKRGRKIRVAPRTSEQVLKYSLPCPKKGDGQNYSFLDTSVHGKIESKETAVCEFCVVCVYYGPCSFAFVSLRLFRCATLTCFSFLACERNDLRKISISNIRECFFAMPLFFSLHPLFFICDLCDFKTSFFLPPGVIATQPVAPVAQRYLVTL